MSVLAGKGKWKAVAAAKVKALNGEDEDRKPPPPPPPPHSSSSSSSSSSFGASSGVPKCSRTLLERARALETADRLVRTVSLLRELRVSTDALLHRGLPRALTAYLGGGMGGVEEALSSCFSRTSRLSVQSVPAQRSLAVFVGCTSNNSDNSDESDDNANSDNSDNG